MNKQLLIKLLQFCLIYLDFNIQILFCGKRRILAFIDKHYLKHTKTSKIVKQTHTNINLK